MEKTKLTYRTIVSHILSRHPRNVPNPCPYQVQGFAVEVPLMVGARAFMRAAKNGNMFAIYAIPTSQPIQKPTKLPAKYEEYRDVFEKKNTNTLPQHRPYDCGIELQEDAQLPLVQSIVSPITNLLHYEITLMKISRRTSFNIPSHLLELLSCLSRKKTAPFGCAWIIVD